MKRLLPLFAAFVITVAGPFALADATTAKEAAQHGGEIQAVRVTDAREGRHGPQLYGEWFGRDLVLPAGTSVEQLVGAVLTKTYPHAAAIIRVLWIGLEKAEGNGVHPEPVQAGQIVIEIDTGKIKFPVSVTVKRCIYKPTDADFRDLLDKMVADLRGNLTVVHAVSGV